MQKLFGVAAVAAALAAIPPTPVPAPRPALPHARTVPCEVMNLFYGEIGRRTPPRRRFNNDGERNRRTRRLA